MKQYLALSLSTLALLGALAGCSSSTEESLTTSPDSSHTTVPEAPVLDLELTVDGEEAYETSEFEEVVTLEAFSGTGNHAVIPEGIHVINSHTFSENTTIEAVTFPSTATEVKNSAFSRCTSLQQIDFGGLTRLGTYSFAGCSALTYLTIPSTVIEIHSNVFFDSAALTTVVMEDGVVSIEDGAFSQCPVLTSVTIPESVAYISATAFDANPNLVFSLVEGSYADEWARELGVKAVYD